MERIASLPAAPLPAGGAEKAARRWQRWRSHPPYATAAHFAQYLAMAGITEDEFRGLLGEPIEAVRDRLPTPAWLAAFARAFSRPPASPARPLPEACRGRETVGFLHAIEPLIAQAQERLHEGIACLIRTQAVLPFDPDTIADMLYAPLQGPLLMQLSRTLVLELHIARLQGFLKGETPEERFQCFVERLRQRETALAMFAQYPVLARQLTICLEH